MEHATPDRFTVRLTESEVHAALARYNADAGLSSDVMITPVSAYRAVLREAALRLGTVPSRCMAVVCWQPAGYRWRRRPPGWPGAVVRLRIRHLSVQARYSPFDPYPPSRPAPKPGWTP